MNSKGITIDDRLLDSLTRFDDTPKKEISDWFSCYKDQVLMPDDIVSAYLEALCRICSGSNGVAEFVHRVSDPTRHDHYMWFALLSLDAREFAVLRRIYESHARKGINHLCELYKTLRHNVDDTLKSENANIKALFETQLSAQQLPPQAIGPDTAAAAVHGSAKVYSWGPPGSTKSGGPKR